MRFRIAALVCLTCVLVAGPVESDRVPFPNVDPAPGDPRFEILSSSADRITISFELPDLGLEEFEIEGRPFHLATIDGGGLTGEIGRPAIPSITRLIALPPDSGARLRILETFEEHLDGYDLLPMQPDDGEDGRAAFVIDEAYYANGDMATGPRVTLGKPGMLRDLRVAPLRVEPVRYDPIGHCLKVARRIDVEVEFFKETGLAGAKHSRSTVPPSYDQLYRALVLNYDGPGEGRRVEAGTYLVIAPDSDSVLTYLEPLMEWRTRMGYPSVLATTTEIGGDDTVHVKNYIQNAYDTWENPPEHVVLVGDAYNSSVIIRTYQGGYSWEVSDHPYTQLEGDDNLPDICIGRLSVENVQRLELVVSKICNYETNPYMTNPEWRRRACLIGDPRDSGVTTIYTMEWIRARLREADYARIDEIYEAPFPPPFAASVNNGVGIVAYRGYGFMSGIDNSEIDALTNGWMLPCATFITCDTGTYGSGTSRAEAFLRAGVSPDSVNGGVAAIGAASLATETYYNNVLSCAMYEGVFRDHLPEMGPMLVRGKLEVYQNFNDPLPWVVDNYMRWYNLMGDPATVCWTDSLDAIVALAPDTVAVGATSVEVVIENDAGEPVEGAWVCLWKDPETHSSAYTDDMGRVNLAVSLPTTGIMKLTVTADNCIPVLEDVPVGVPDENLALDDFTISDDSVGGSSGNGDGLVNPAESIEISIRLTNRGIAPAENVTAVLRSTDAFVTVSDSVQAFGDIGAGESIWGGGDFDFEVDPACPDGRVLPLDVEIRWNTGAGTALVEIPVVAPCFAVCDVQWFGAGENGILDPGESAEVSVGICNAGSSPAAGVSASLISLSSHLIVEDPDGYYGSIASGDTVDNAIDRFEVSASPTCFHGHLAMCLVATETAAGVRDTVGVGLRVGASTTGWRSIHRRGEVDSTSVSGT